MNCCHSVSLILFMLCVHLFTRIEENVGRDLNILLRVGNMKRRAKHCMVKGAFQNFQNALYLIMNYASPLHVALLII
jgi:hypothetical protein